VDTVITITLLAFLTVTAITILRVRSLFAAVMLAGIYSFLSAGVFVAMDAVDVAFTESAVGAGISTILMLGALALVGSEEKKPTKTPLLPLLVVLITGGVLVYATLDLPAFGEASNPVHGHVAERYLVDSAHEVGVQNVVTSVLASYRGYDTMGETGVVFTALVGVLILLGGKRRDESGST